MAVDYLSTLNKNGSGLNLTELATGLVQAETTPRIMAAEKKKASAELSISAFGQLRSAFEDFDSALSIMSGTSVLTASSDTAALSVEVTDIAKAAEATSYIEVAQVAKRQVLEFTGFTSEDQVIGTGGLLVEFGVWTSDTEFTANPNYEANSIAIGTGSTLTELATALSSMDGVTARVLDRGDGTFTLGVVSEEGAGRALRMTVGNPTGGLDTFDTSASKATAEVQGASDAMLYVDGLTVFRSSNVIDDVIDGVTLTLTGTTDTAATVNVTRDSELAYEVLDTFVTQVNTTLNKLRSMTAYGTETDDAGDLAGDRYAKQLLTTMTSVLKSPIYGHKDGPVYLADLGVATARNGELYMNKTVFDTNYARDPASFDAVFSDTFSASDSSLEVFGTANASTVAGTYKFSLDVDTGSVTLNGLPLLASVLEDGRLGFAATVGKMSGVSIIAPAQTMTADVSYGRSLVSMLQSAMNDALEVGGLFDNRAEFFTSVISDQDATLEDLDAKAAALETRYLKQFAAMESAITSMKSTSEYLTNMVDSWNNSN